MLPFYRFIRPVRFNYKRSELTTLPRGGICLRFEQAENENLWFSYSRCHPDDLFNKVVAKQIADSKAEVIRNSPVLLDIFSVLPPSKNTDALVSCIFDFSKSISTVSEISLVHQYLLLDVRLFSTALAEIHTENKKQEALLEHWSKALDGISKTVYSR